MAKEKDSYGLLALGDQVLAVSYDQCEAKGIKISAEIKKSLKEKIKKLAEVPKKSVERYLDEVNCEIYQVVDAIRKKQKK